MGRGAADGGKESVVPRNRLRRNVSQSSDASEADCPATGFVSKKLSAFADGWVRRRSGISVRPAASNSRRRGYNFDAQGLGTGQDAWQGDDRHGRGPRVRPDGSIDRNASGHVDPVRQVKILPRALTFLQFKAYF